MSRLRDKLVQDYSEHYLKFNARVGDGALPPRIVAAMRIMYYDIVSTLPRGSVVLDLGCGTGLLLQWLAAYGVTPIGVDSSAAQVQVARQALPGITVVCDDGLAFLRQYAGELAGIFCTDVLEHIPDQDICLEWMEAAHAALAPGGFLFVKVPNAANLTGLQLRFEDLTHERSFTLSSLQQLLRAAGFQHCQLVPVRASHFGGRTRLIVERMLHRLVYRICGDASEQVFTRTVSVVAYKG